MVIDNVLHVVTRFWGNLPSDINILFFPPLSSNLTALSNDACWRETSRACEGKPGTPAPGFAPRWLTLRTDPLTTRRGARAQPTTPQRRGSLWRKVRGVYGRMRRMTATKPEPDRQLRNLKTPRARPFSQLWLFNARYYTVWILTVCLHSHAVLWHSALKTRDNTKTAPSCSRDSSLKANSSFILLLRHMKSKSQRLSDRIRQSDNWVTVTVSPTWCTCPHQAPN